MKGMMEVVVPFTQSGIYVRQGVLLEVKHVGRGSQDACEFEEGYISTHFAHSCSGHCDMDRGLWIYKYFLRDNCKVYNNAELSWEL